MNGGIALRNQRASFVHGTRHAPDGSDPSYAGFEHQVGGTYSVNYDQDRDGVAELLTFDEPEQFINGTNASPTDTSPNPAPLTIRLVVGPPNVMDTDGVTIIRYTEHALEICGDVTDVAFGDTVFILRPEYRFPTDKPLKGHDDFGNYVPCRLLTTGEFIWGVP